MDIQELNQFESAYQPSKEVAFCWLRKQYVQLSTEENHTEIVDHANDLLRIWQAAKAQAVPEGFVVVPKEPTDEMWSSGIDAYTDAMEDNKALPAASINDIYKAMIEAQDPAND